MSTVTAVRITCDHAKMDSIDMYENECGYENTPGQLGYVLDKQEGTDMLTVSDRIPLKDCYIGRGWYAKMLNDVYKKKGDENDAEVDAMYRGSPCGVEHIKNTLHFTIDMDKVAVIFSRRLSKATRPFNVPLEYVGWCVITDN